MDINCDIFVDMELMELCQPIPGVGLSGSNESLTVGMFGALDVTTDRNWSEPTTNQNATMNSSMTGFMVESYNGKYFCFVLLVFRIERPILGDYLKPHKFPCSGRLPTSVTEA